MVQDLYESEPARSAEDYEVSQLQAVLYGPVHDAVLSYARQHVPHPARILDVGCGTGRLPSRLVFAYRGARVVGVDASTPMIARAGNPLVVRRARFAVAAAEQLPFADAAFDLVVVTLSASHWRDKAAGLAEIGRVMAPDAMLVLAEVCPAPARRGRGRPWPGLQPLIAVGSLRVEHVEPIRSVALIADAALIAAKHQRNIKSGAARSG